MDVSSTSHHECAIFLTGAPLSGTTDFESSDSLVETYLPAFCRFLDEHDQPGNKEERDAATSHSHTISKAVNWRFIPVTDDLLPSFDEQGQLNETVTNPKVPLSDLSCDRNVNFCENHLTDSPDTDFYESSCFWHNNINCSQATGREDHRDATVSATLPTYGRMYSHLTHSKVEQSFGESVFPSILKDQSLLLVPLSDLPTAGDVDRLMPQTVTVSLLVIALNINFKCQLRARRTGQRFDLVELSVGDDTQNKFNINIWLKSSVSSSRLINAAKPSFQMDNSRSTINMIKTGDLLLLENIVLTSWEGCVCGQNLWKRIGNIETKIHIVEKKQFDSPLSSNLANRIAKVQNWAMENVESMRDHLDDTANESTFLTRIPPDTQ